MARQRHRSVGVGLRKADAPCGEAIQHRRQRAARVRADPIGAERIDGDEQEVRSPQRASLQI
jgi:hypothetical protein